MRSWKVKNKEIIHVTLFTYIYTSQLSGKVKKFQFRMPRGLTRNAWNEESKRVVSSYLNHILVWGGWVIRWSQLRLWDNILKPQFFHLQNGVNNI